MISRTVTRGVNSILNRCLRMHYVSVGLSDLPAKPVKRIQNVRRFARHFVIVSLEQSDARMLRLVVAWSGRCPKCCDARQRFKTLNVSARQMAAYPYMQEIV